MSPDLQTIVSIIGSAIVTTLLGGIWKGIVNINQKIEKVLLENQEHKTMIESHKSQFVDLWKKTSEIDLHLQSTDKNIAALQERTKKI